MQSTPCPLSGARAMARGGRRLFFGGFLALQRCRAQGDLSLPQFGNLWIFRIYLEDSGLGLSGVRVGVSTCRARASRVERVSLTKPLEPTAQKTSGPSLSAFESVEAHLALSSTPSATPIHSIKEVFQTCFQSWQVRFDWHCSSAWRRCSGGGGGGGVEAGFKL